MSETAEFGRAPMVRFERILPGPIKRVWEFITTPERLPEWFGHGIIEPREGGAVSFMDGHVRGVVTQWQPPRRLTYTWNVLSPGEMQSAYPESYLTIELEPQGDRVRLVLTHLPVLERFEKQNAMGWHTYLDLLDAAINDERGRTRKESMAINARRYGVDLANLVR